MSRQYPDFELYASGRPMRACMRLRRSRAPDIARRYPPNPYGPGVNDALPSDINVLVLKSAPQIPIRHDASRGATSTTSPRRRTAFGKQFVWWVKDDLDVERMLAAAARFAGLHRLPILQDDDPDGNHTGARGSHGIHEDATDTDSPSRDRIFSGRCVRRLVGVRGGDCRGGLSETDPLRCCERSELPARLTAPASASFSNASTTKWTRGTRRFSRLSSIVRAVTEQITTTTTRAETPRNSF